MYYKKIYELWDSYVYLKENKHCDKDNLCWGTILLFLYNGKLQNNKEINVLDFIEDVYNKCNIDKEFNDICNKIYRHLLTCLISGRINYEN